MIDTTSTGLGANLKRLRASRTKCPHCGSIHSADPLTQEQLSAAADVSRPVISDLERGAPAKSQYPRPRRVYADTVERLAKALCCKVSDLLD